MTFILPQRHKVHKEKLRFFFLSELRVLVVKACSYRLVKGNAQEVSIFERFRQSRFLSGQPDSFFSIIFSK